MLDRPDIAPMGLRAPAPLPVAELVRGKPVAEVVELVPRLFNLCRAAQTMAIRMALGLPAGAMAPLVEEITREHILRLAVILPVRLGLPALDFPRGDMAEAAAALLGDGGLPETAGGFQEFLDNGRGIAPVLARITAVFGPGVACAGDLPVTRPDTALDRSAQENSVAARQRHHPLMRHIEQNHGRGPLWRVVGRALDLQDTARGRLPPPCQTGDGVAVVPAARGLYAVRARAADGLVTGLTRRTPTDHLLAPGGVMAQALASLPPDRHGHARVLVDILDPCTPVELKGPGNA